jgi:hypothetical protein
MKKGRRKEHGRNEMKRDEDEENNKEARTGGE